MPSGCRGATEGASAKAVSRRVQEPRNVGTLWHLDSAGDTQRLLEVPLPKVTVFIGTLVPADDRTVVTPVDLCLLEPRTCLKPGLGRHIRAAEVGSQLLRDRTAVAETLNE